MLCEGARWPRQQRPWRKRNNRCDNAKHDRLENKLCSNDSGIETFTPATFDLPVNVLTDHNRIINDHANHKQNCESRQNVPRHSEERHQHNAASEGCNDPNRYPERHNWAQEQDQDQHHQNSTQQSRFRDQLHPRLEGLRVVPQDLDLHPVRQDACRWVVCAINVIAEAVGIVHDVHSVRLNHHNKSGWAAIMGRIEIGIDKSVDDFSHIANTDRALVIRLTHNDLFKLLLRVRQSPRRH